MSIFNNHSAEILVLIFFFITYLISVLEKVTNWSETVAYYTNHFKDTILHKMISLLLINVVIFEIAVFVLINLGLYLLVTTGETIIALIGLEISAITLLMFLLGQRLAKDYSGAMNIAVYFILNIIGVYLLT